MASYGELTVYQVLANKSLLRELSKLFGVTQKFLRPFLLKHRQDAQLKDFIKYVPPEWVAVKVASVRHNQPLIDLLAFQTHLSRRTVVRKLDVHGRTLISNEFVFPWPEMDSGETEDEESAYEETEEDETTDEPEETHDESERDTSESADGPTVFCSYSHKDRRFVDLFKVHLKPIGKRYKIEFWDDSMIKPGAKWKDEIASAIDRAAAAVLFVSAHFLASDFIETDEIPPLLMRAQKRGTKILPLIVGHCLFKHHPELSCFQAFNDPSKPLAGMGKNQRDKVFVSVASQIGNILDLAS